LEIDLDRLQGDGVIALDEFEGDAGDWAVRGATPLLATREGRL
jgi:hypothetical protein